MPRNRVDIAIVGGGLVGASLACALAPLIERHGLRVAVIEAAPLNDAQAATFQPSFDARASAIAQGSRRHFERLGVWATMAERATPIRQIHVSERGRFGATRLTADEFDLDALGYVIPNAWMGQVLHAALGALPLTWHCPARVDDIVPIADGHRLTLSDGACLEAGLTVLADGGRSGLKERLGIASQAQPYEQHALIANVEVGRDRRPDRERRGRRGVVSRLPRPPRLVRGRPVRARLPRADERRARGV